ncbi:MAG: 2-dehydropantoate 2-reductase [Clostridiales bacterium]|nr:2-dehydropantoate 2-reductase [Clostridiales bacterium]
MEVLIVGTGAVGVGMAATLHSVGCGVSLLARGATKDAILAGGLRRTGLFGEVVIPAGETMVSDDYGAFPENAFDYILISVKTMANKTVSDALWEHHAILKPQGKLVILQNGWDNDQAYLRHFPQEQVCCARVITGFQRQAPNVSNVTVHTAPVLLGNLYGLDVAPLEPLAQAINAGGIPCQTTEDVGAALWAKMLYNCTLNPLGAVLGVHYGALGEAPEGVAIMNDLIDEIFAVMTAAEYRTYWDTPEDYKKEFYGKLLPDTYHHNSSTLQDIRRKRPTEIDTLTGKVLELAAQYHVSVPANTMLYRQVKTIEANY